jgi:hypothetical protein
VVDADGDFGQRTSQAHVNMDAWLIKTELEGHSARNMLGFRRVEATYKAD